MALCILYERILEAPEAKALVFCKKGLDSSLKKPYLVNCHEQVFHPRPSLLTCVLSVRDLRDWAATSALVDINSRIVLH